MQFGDFEISAMIYVSKMVEIISVEAKNQYLFRNHHTFSTQLFCFQQLVSYSFL